MQGLKLPQRRSYLRALDLYQTHGIDFEDALTAAHMERLGLTELFSYDRDFDSLKGIGFSRIEP
jgi:predicted nucleic acid-binding protein